MQSDSCHLQRHLFAHGEVTVAGSDRKLILYGLLGGVVSKSRRTPQAVGTREKHIVRIDRVGETFYTVGCHEAIQKAANAGQRSKARKEGGGAQPPPLSRSRAFREGIIPIAERSNLATFLNWNNSHRAPSKIPFEILTTTPLAAPPKLLYLRFTIVQGSMRAQSKPIIAVDFPSSDGSPVFTTSTVGWRTPPLPGPSGATKYTYEIPVPSDIFRTEPRAPNDPPDHDKGATRSAIVSFAIKVDGKVEVGTSLVSLGVIGAVAADVDALLQHFPRPHPSVMGEGMVEGGESAPRWPHEGVGVHAPEGAVGGAGEGGGRSCARAAGGVGGVDCGRPLLHWANPPLLPHHLGAKVCAFAAECGRVWLKEMEKLDVPSARTWRSQQPPCPPPAKRSPGASPLDSTLTVPPDSDIAPTPGNTLFVASAASFNSYETRDEFGRPVIPWEPVVARIPTSKSTLPFFFGERSVRVLVGPESPPEEWLRTHTPTVLECIHSVPREERGGGAPTPRGPPHSFSDALGLRREAFESFGSIGPSTPAPTPSHSRPVRVEVVRGGEVGRYCAPSPASTMHGTPTSERHLTPRAPRRCDSSTASMVYRCAGGPPEGGRRPRVDRVWGRGVRPIARPSAPMAERSVGPGVPLGGGSYPLTAPPTRNPLPRPDPLRDVVQLLRQSGVDSEEDEEGSEVADTDVPADDRHAHAHPAGRGTPSEVSDDQAFGSLFQW